LWVCGFYQYFSTDVLLRIKVALLRNICFAKKKGFSQEEIKVLIRGKGLTMMR
jgi:hypothetical protein